MGRDKWNEITDKYRLSKWVAEERYADQKQNAGMWNSCKKSIEMYTRGKKVQCHIYIVFCFDAKRLSWDYEDKIKSSNQ